MGIQQSHDPGTTQRLAKELSLPSNEPSDETLLQALASGSVWPMEHLYQRYSGLLYSLGYRIVGDHQLAEELVQDAFVAVWQHATLYSPQAGSVRWWLISLMRHRTIDYLRGMRRRSSLKEIPWEEIEREEDAALPDVWEDVWCSLQLTQVQEALQQLPDEQRQAITLAYFQGWTHSEIARRCQLPFGTVKARIRLGLLHLKWALEQREISEISSSGNKNRGKARPKQAVTVLVQATETGCATGHELCQNGVFRCFGYTEWEHLVEEIEAFEFRGTAGSFTARKVRRPHNRAYWYALPCGSVRRGKLYLGRSTQLTLAHLEAMASKLHEEK